MSAPIGPGDWVECVESGKFACDEVVAGRVYEVAAAGEGRCSRSDCNGVWVRLTNDRVSGDWCGVRFRPIYRPKQELIESLKQPAPEREREAA